MPLLDKLLKEKPKSSQDTLSKLLAALNALEVGNEKDNEKALANVAKYLGFLKYHLFGDGEHEVTKEEALERARELVATDLLYLLVKHLVLLDFEARKDAAQVYGMLVRLRDSDDRSPGAAYVLQHPYILSKLFHGYDDSGVALNCGAMLKDSIRYEALARQVLESSIFMEFFDKVEVANFEIASDAFATFKDLLTRHKPFVAQFLQDHYNEFFPAYNKLLQSGNYVTRRQSLKLLGELLLDRSNVKVMVRFVSEPQYLMQLMRMIKDQSRSIQFEAFHVFKVFVANPNKPQPIIDILTGNKEKLLKYLEEFHTDKDDDEQFKEEKAVIIKEISMLGLQPAGAGGAAARGPA
ncbi:Mo25-like protein [Haematococcus lacustris]